MLDCGLLAADVEDADVLLMTFQEEGNCGVPILQNSFISMCSQNGRQDRFETQAALCGLNSHSRGGFGGAEPAMRTRSEDSGYRTECGHFAAGARTRTKVQATGAFENKLAVEETPKRSSMRFV